MEAKQDKSNEEQTGQLRQAGVMRRLFLLRPKEGNMKAWEPWYDKAFGFVVRADTEEQARLLAHGDSGDETPWQKDTGPWLDPAQSTCEELTANGEAGVVIRDFAAA